MKKNKSYPSCEVFNMNCLKISGLRELYIGLYLFLSYLLTIIILTDLLQSLLEMLISVDIDNELGC